MLNYKLYKILNTTVCWIPVRKLRDDFRSRYCNKYEPKTEICFLSEVVYRMNKVTIIKYRIGCLD